MSSTYDGTMKIGQLARTTGVSTKTIRYYESIGLLPQAARAANGYRTYESNSMDQLRFIRDAQASGLTLTEIASVIELREQGASTCEHVTQLLETHLKDLDRHIASLQRTRTQLAALTKRAHNLDPATCSDPNRCQTIAVGVDPLDGVASKVQRTHVHRH